MKVKDRMSKNPITTTPDTSVDEALALMREHGVRHLPVSEDNQVVGMVTDIELRTAWLASQLEELSVKDLMNPEALTIDAEATVYQAARILHQEKLTGLLVHEEGNLVGVITLADVLEVFLDLMGILSDSSRVDVALKSEPQALEQAHGVIRDQGGEVTCVAMVSSEPERRVYSFRLAKTDLEPIVKALEGAGHEVLDY